MTLKTSGKVDNFIKFYDLPRDIALVLLESEKDCQEFFEGFYMRNRFVIDDLLDYREYKIEKSQKTLDLFVKECYTSSSMRIAFEKTFYQSFSDKDIEMVAEAILNGRITLDQLFADFKKNPNKNILKNIL